MRIRHLPSIWLGLQLWSASQLSLLWLLWTGLGLDFTANSCLQLLAGGLGAKVSPKMKRV